MTRGARALIRPAALAHNLGIVRARAPAARIMAAVKGNAYGHGLVTAAHALAAADSLAVARLVEAFALRAAGVDLPIVLLPGVLSVDELTDAADLRCELVVHNVRQAELLERSAGHHTVWLKVDTGMHRLGVTPAETVALLARLRQCSGVDAVRLMTHLAAADDTANASTGRQFEAFRVLTHGFDGDISAANSAALFGWQEGIAGRDYWGNRGDVWVRPGIALYGISPFPGRTGSDYGLRPAMHFSSRLVAVKPVGAGARVGYGGHWMARQDTTLGIVAAGYADGYTRFLPSGTPLSINGRRVPLAGIVSMDLAAVDLGPDARDRVGDTVVLWGDGLPVEDVARAAGTIPYQLVTGVMHREAPEIDTRDEPASVRP